MKTGVLGGTFNPVHYGHLRAAEEVRQALGLDSILFLPSGNPPLKNIDLAPARKRLTMTELAAASNEAFEVSDLEVVSEAAKSYTVETLRELRDLRPGEEFLFILGLDAFLDIPNWWMPDELVRSVDFVVIGRPGVSFGQLRGSPYMSVEADVLARLDEGAMGLYETRLAGGSVAFLLAVTPLFISATAIRDALKAGESVKYLLPEEVESFIMSHGLYAG